MKISEFLITHKIFFEESALLSKKTWIKTGGICAYWITPHSVQQLKEVCSYLYQNNFTFDLVGHTSNIFFHSTYNPEIIVSTVKVNQYEFHGDYIICDCGVSVIKLAKDCMAQGYAGFSGLVGLPGTVASAAVNNAGCFQCSISSMLISAEVLMPDGIVKTFVKDDFGYENRSSRFKRGEVKGIVLSVKLKLQKAENIEEEFKKSEETKIYRKTRQEGPAQNLGSVYSTLKRKNNLRNMVAKVMAAVAGKAGIANRRQAYKKLLLGIYGYGDLNDYISDKKINTFVWRNADAEQKFIRYKEFMGKVFDNLTIEIEERQ